MERDELGLPPLMWGAFVAVLLIGAARLCFDRYLNPQMTYLAEIQWVSPRFVNNADPPATITVAGPHIRRGDRIEVLTDRPVGTAVAQEGGAVIRCDVQSFATMPDMAPITAYHSRRGRELDHVTLYVVDVRVSQVAAQQDESEETSPSSEVSFSQQVSEP